MSRVTSVQLGTSYKFRFVNRNEQLNWQDHCYNLMLSGPSGTGKAYISAGLGYV